MESQLIRDTSWDLLSAYHQLPSFFQTKSFFKNHRKFHWNLLKYEIFRNGWSKKYEFSPQGILDFIPGAEGPWDGILNYEGWKYAFFEVVIGF